MHCASLDQDALLCLQESGRGRMAAMKGPDRVVAEIAGKGGKEVAVQGDVIGIEAEACVSGRATGAVAQASRYASPAIRLP
jgi:hypothetical protein